MNKLFENDYLSIENDNEVFFYTWKTTTENLTEKQFLTETQKVAEEVFKLNPKYIIGDYRDLKFAIAPNLQEKINTELIVLLNNFLVKYAHISSNELISQLSTEQLFEENTERTYEDKFFETLETAKKWIYNK